MICSVNDRGSRAALTIAGSDSGGGAGIQADLKTFAALGVYGTSAITAITAQNTIGVIASLPLPADLVTAQIEAVAGDIAIHATKIGMLATAAIVEAVAAAIEELELPLVVVDPVMLAKSGDRLLDDDGVQDAVRGAAAARARGDAEHSGGRSAERACASDRSTTRARRRDGFTAWAHRRRSSRADTASGRGDRRSAVRRRAVHRVPDGAHRDAEHARHRLHVRVGGRRAARAGTFARRGDRAAPSSTSPARSGTASRSATATARSTISGRHGPRRR